MSEPDDETFEQVLKLAARFERHMDKDNRGVSWEEMIAEIEALPIDEQNLILGLVRAKMKANGSEHNSSTVNSNQ